MPSPLHPLVYLRRNIGKTIPLVAVIILAVMLIAGIVSIMNSIPLSIRTIYGYSQNFVGITPRGDATQTADLRQQLLKNAPVPIERVITLRGSDFQVRSIVGKWPFIVLAMNQADMRYYVEKQGGGKVDGRYPKTGAAEAIISQPIATNLGLKIGDELLGPTNPDAFSTNSVRIVGIIENSAWMALGSVEYYQQFHFPPVDVFLAFAKDRSDQEKLGKWAVDFYSGQNVRVLTFDQVEADTDTMFSILYRILNVVIGTLVVVITLMMGMLINIYLSQRLQEFGLLQAIGYTKKEIISRVILENLIVVFGGWVLGSITAFGLLTVVQKTLMEPSAFALNALDPMAYLYTIPVPCAILGVAIATVVRKFRSFDPIGIVERRLV